MKPNNKEQGQLVSPNQAVEHAEDKREGTSLTGTESGLTFGGRSLSPGIMRLIFLKPVPREEQRRSPLEKWFFPFNY